MLERLAFSLLLLFSCRSNFSADCFPPLLDVGRSNVVGNERRLLQRLIVEEASSLRGGALLERKTARLPRRPSSSTARYAGSRAKFRNFEEMLAAYNDTPVLVSFHAKFCGPCRLAKKELAVVSDDLGDNVKMFAVDADKFPKLGARYSIEGLPCIIVFKGGKMLEKIEGVESAEEIVRRVKTYMTEETT